MLFKGVTITKSVGEIQIRTTFGLEIRFRPYFFEAKVSEALKGKVCGLCGNFTRDGTDDFAKRDGRLAATPVEFGLSWKNENFERK